MLRHGVIRSGARFLPGGVTSATKVAASATAPSPSATTVRALARQAQFPKPGSASTSWKRPVLVPADTGVPSWRQQVDRGRDGDESSSRSSSDNGASFIRKLEALRLINVGGSAQKEQREGQQQMTTLQISSISTNNGGTVSVPEGYSAMNRNNRKPKKANHGARPCSRYARRGKKRKWGNPRR
mmetsp:Transcript_3812/g.8320  ORF Transcript_3812/g.8320 Transcript_3812/m.8320 type:complete len:184 (+) Transcript_3812:82-633(+)